MDRRPDGRGSYIFIYLPDGQCLAAPGRARGPAAPLERCDLSPASAGAAWVRGVLVGGHDYYQLRNLANGRCLTASGRRSAAPAAAPAGLQPASAAGPLGQLIAFWW